MLVTLSHSGKVLNSRDTLKSAYKSKIGLTINDETSFDEKTVAETFNSFFTTVAAQLVKNFHHLQTCMVRKRWIGIKL